MGKGFQTYNKQMKYLRDNKKIQCSGSTDKELLVRNGYFNLINGYKEPFITNKSVNGQHSYIKNLELKEFKYVKDFDEELRFILLRYITRVEEEVRTLFGYKFEQLILTGHNWNNVESYSNQVDTKKIIDTITDIYNEIKLSKQPYINHYIENHNFIPIWVMVKTIHFSTLIEMLMNSKSEVKEAICNLYEIEYDGFQNSKDFKKLEVTLNFLRTVKNSCLNNERIYGITKKNSRVYTKFHLMLPNVYSKEKDNTIFDLIIYLKYYLPRNEYYQLIKSVKKLLVDLNKKVNQQSFNKVRVMMGLRQREHLDLLLEETKVINYKQF